MRVEGTKQGRTPSSLAVPLAPEVTVWRRRLAPYAARDWAPAGEVITRRREGTRKEQVGRRAAPAGLELALRAFSFLGPGGPRWLSRASLPVRVFCAREARVADSTVTQGASPAEPATPSSGAPGRVGPSSLTFGSHCDPFLVRFSSERVTRLVLGT
uniref:Uncharacterized protein n=1 Tax=Myotis myotis TaxID=51298 RepID=A0A7J7ZY55_MYOMY|nr:hypothetical protein mMyoMyo1_009919 [Myotis myotis]